MGVSRTAIEVRLTSLQPHDAGPVRRWLSDFLKAHLRTWIEARGLGWTEGELEAQLLAADLVGEHWFRLVRASAREDQCVLVARIGSRAVGVVWAGEQVDDYLRVPGGVLHWVVVDRTTRGRGVGRALIREARSWMAGRGLQSVSVHVLSDNEAAVRLYRSAGLQVADLRMMGPLSPADADGGR